MSPRKIDLDKTKTPVMPDEQIPWPDYTTRTHFDENKVWSISDDLEFRSSAIQKSKIAKKEVYLNT